MAGVQRVPVPLLARREPSPQDLRDAPGLRDTAAGLKRLLGIEDFTDTADASNEQVISECL